MHFSLLPLAFLATLTSALDVFDQQINVVYQGVETIGCLTSNGSWKLLEADDCARATLHFTGTDPDQLVVLYTDQDKQHQGLGGFTCNFAQGHLVCDDQTRKFFGLALDGKTLLTARGASRGFYSSAMPAGDEEAEITREEGVVRFELQFVDKP